MEAKEQKQHNFLIGLCITLATIIIGLISFILYSNNLSNQKTRCEYNGWAYADGETYQSSDGCNSCVCSNGQTICTQMACTNTN